MNEELNYSDTGRMEKAILQVKDRFKPEMVLDEVMLEMLKEIYAEGYFEGKEG